MLSAVGQLPPTAQPVPPAFTKGTLLPAASRSTGSVGSNEGLKPSDNLTDLSKRDFNLWEIKVSRSSAVSCVSAGLESFSRKSTP
jgi:hypothetical protein